MPAKTVSQEISHLVREKGYPQKRAVAAALSMERAGKIEKEDQNTDEADVAAADVEGVEPVKPPRILVGVRKAVEDWDKIVAAGVTPAERRAAGASEEGDDHPGGGKCGDVHPGLTHDEWRVKRRDSKDPDDSIRFILSQKTQHMHANDEKFNKIGPLNKAEGDRGGKVIGHTSSGKPIYAGKHKGNSFVRAHEGWSRQDHEDAAQDHLAAAKDADDKQYRADRSRGRGFAAPSFLAESRYHNKMAQAHTKAGHAVSAEHSLKMPALAAGQREEANQLAAKAAGHYSAAFKNRSLQKSETPMQDDLAKAKRVPADYFRTIANNDVPFTGKPGKGKQVGGMPIGKIKAKIAAGKKGKAAPPAAKAKGKKASPPPPKKKGKMIAKPKGKAAAMKGKKKIRKSMYDGVSVLDLAFYGHPDATALVKAMPAGVMETFKDELLVKGDDGSWYEINTRALYPDDHFEKAGPFIGPHGGKWADQKHTIPWSDKKHAGKPEPKAKEHDAHESHNIVLISENNAKKLNSTRDYMTASKEARSEHHLAQQKEAIQRNLANKMASGEYDHAKATTLWAYHTKAVSDHAAAHGLGGKADPATRMHAAKELADTFVTEAKAGEHDHHLNKKNAKAVGSLREHSATGSAKQDKAAAKQPGAWGTNVPVEAMNASTYDRVTSAKELKSRLPNWSKDDHTAAARLHADKANDMARQHGAARAEAVADHGESSVATAGGVDSKFPEDVNNKLRSLAHAASAHRRAAALHHAASGSRKSFQEAGLGSPSGTYSIPPETKKSDRSALDLVKSATHEPNVGVRMGSLTIPAGPDYTQGLTSRTSPTRLAPPLRAADVSHASKGGAEDALRLVRLGDGRLVSPRHGMTFKPEEK